MQIESFYFLFIAGIIVGIGCIAAAIFFHLKRARKKLIATFPIADKISFSVPHSGKYSVFMIGGWQADNFSIWVTHENDKAVDVYEQFPKSQVVMKGRSASDYFYFDTAEAGNHNLEIFNLQKLEVYESKLFTLSMFQKPKPVYNLAIGIKEYSHPMEFIASLLFGFVGCYAILGSIVYLLYKLEIVVPS